MEFDVSPMITPPSSERALIRFEDPVDENVPRIRYKIPLPGAVHGRFYVECRFNIPRAAWRAAAFRDNRVTPIVRSFSNQLQANAVLSIVPLERLVVVDQAVLTRPARQSSAPVGSLASTGGENPSKVSAPAVVMTQSNGEPVIRFETLEIPGPLRRAERSRMGVQLVRRVQ